MEDGLESCYRDFSRFIAESWGIRKKHVPVNSAVLETNQREGSKGK